MNLFFRFLLGLLLTAASCLAAAASQQPLSIGLFPNLSTRLLLETYQPLREFLEQQLKQPVMIYTSPDFNSFISRTQSGEYDIIVTAPHFARLAQTDAGYQPLFAYRNNITAAVVVRKDSQINDVSQLRGAKIAAPDRLAMVTLLGLKLLQERGLEAGRDYAFQWTTTHSNVALAVLRGDAAAGIIGIMPLKQLPENISRQLQLLTATPSAPSQMLLAHQRLSSDQLLQFKAAMLQFEQSEAGQKFFKSSGLAGLKPLGSNDLKPLDPYAREVKRMLESPR